MMSVVMAVAEQDQIVWNVLAAVFARDDVVDLEVARGAAAIDAAPATVALDDQTSDLGRNVVCDRAIRREPIGVALGAVGGRSIDRDQLPDRFLRCATASIAAAHRDL